MRGEILYIEKNEAIDFLLPRHYSGRKPQISIAFGWYIDGDLKAVCTFGKPASNTLCDGICGKSYSPNVYELNRLCRVDGFNEQLSQFVGGCLRRLSIKDWIIVSYSDSAMNHNGYIYQACNFIYTGITKERKEFYVKDGHSRHGNKDSEYRQIRTAKHRYVYFATKNKALKTKWKDSLNYPILPYPKGENKNYELGDYLKPKIVCINNSAVGKIF